MSCFRSMVIIICLFLGNRCYSQRDAIEKRIVSFLEEVGEFVPATPDYQLTYVVNILTHEVYRGNEYGIFRIGVTASHSKTYIMMLHNGRASFYSLNELGEELEELISSMKSMGKYTSSEMFIITERILDVYLKNRDLSK